LFCCKENILKNNNFGKFSILEKKSRKSIVQHNDDVLTFWTPQRNKSLTEWIFNFIYLGTKFISPPNIEKLSNLHAHVYYNMLVAISDRIKIAQYWCKGVVFPNIRKCNNNKKGPVIAE
jgi:hypothetical protein